MDPHVSQVPVLLASTHQAVTDLVTERDQLSVFLQHQLQRAQLRMKNKADKHRSERSFEVGEHVYLKLQPYVQS